MEFNKALRNARESMRLTQSQVARQLGISVSTYTKYETASNEPDLKMLVKLADFYQLSLDVLLRGGEKRTDEKWANLLEVTDEEREIVTCYRMLDDVSKGRLMERLLVLLESKKNL